MILPDVNILVQAFRSDASHHAVCRKWLDGVVNGEARYGMAPQVLSSVIRITSHPRVFAEPSSLDEVLVLLRNPIASTPLCRDPPGRAPLGRIRPPLP